MRITYAHTHAYIYIYVFTTPNIVGLKLIYEPSNYLGAVQLLAKK